MNDGPDSLVPNTRSSADPRVVRRVLLLDDEKPVHEMVPRALARESVAVVSAFTGEEGLARIEQERFDVLLLDMGLPDLSGIEILHRLREGGRLRNLPVIVFTGWTTTREKVEGLEAGASDYITKPVESAELRARVRALLRQIDLRDELAAARDRAEAAARARSRFLGTVSHELRTPLHGVIASAGLLQETRLDAAQMELVETVRRSSELLMGTINNVLDFSALDAGRIELRNGPVVLREFMEEIVKLLAAPAVSKGIQLKLELAPDLPHQVTADADRLHQVLLNLVGNAVKFTTRGGVTLAVTGRRASGGGGAAADQCLVHFEVRDTGPGFAPGQLDHLFDFHALAEAAPARDTGGVGIGLPLSQRLVRLMGGEIEAANNPRGGAILRFDVRVSVLERAEASESRPEASLPTPSLVNPGLADRHPLRVLVVDDNAVNRRVMERLLQHLGYLPDLCDNGAAAVEAVKLGRYDVVLMDSQMPVMDGCAATRAIRAFEQESGQPRVNILAMTANVLEEERDQCLRSGMDDHLTKPVRAHVLARALVRHAGSRRAGPVAESSASTETPRSRPVSNAVTPSRVPGGVDMDRLSEFCDGDVSEINDLLAIYFQQADTRMAGLRSAVATGDAEGVRREAHACGGASSQIGFVSTAFIMGDLEQRGSRGDLDNAVELLASAERSLQEARGFLAAKGLGAQAAK